MSTKYARVHESLLNNNQTPTTALWARQKGAAEVSNEGFGGNYNWISVGIRFRLSTRLQSGRWRYRLQDWVRYYEGDGVPQDYAEAMKWFRKASDQGSSAARFGIGTMHADGKGVTQNYGEALKCYRKAADKGNTTAQHAIGLMYTKGEGVT
jgi:TPR repeat protein